jgi:hypothetical protein
MKNKIRQWLINLANKIGDKDYYDFGEPITQVVVFGDTLIVSTKHSIYGNRGGKSKWLKVKPTNK